MSCSNLASTDPTSSFVTTFFIVVFYVSGVGFLLIVTLLTFRDARNVKIYETRVGELEREMIPTSNLILGRMSRHNSNVFTTTQQGNVDNFDDHDGN